MVSKQLSPHWDHSPFPFPSATNPTSPVCLRAFSATLLPHIFRYLCLLPQWESWGLWEWHCQHSITHLCTPCSPPFLWSADIILSFLAKFIHSYLPRLHSTYFTLSPIFSSSFFSPVFFLSHKTRLKMSYKQDKKGSLPIEKSSKNHASLRLIPICSLSCSHTQSLFLSSYLILFRAWLQFSPSGTNVLISNPPLLAHLSETFHFFQWANSIFIWRSSLFFPSLRLLLPLML